MPNIDRAGEIYYFILFPILESYVLNFLINFAKCMI